jgi:flagellar biosynthesis/type III secretory pathway chaperone
MHADTQASLRIALDRARQLEALLEQEFKALRVRDLDVFEAAQPTREQLLSTIAEVGATQSAETLEQDPVWQEVRTCVLRCRDLHRRNELLIQHQLASIRHTLDVLHGNQGSTQTYDRLGKLARKQAQRWIDDA